MSDINDELSRLVETKDSVSKRRRGNADDEELYPLKGKYVDEHDRERILSLSEFERKDIIAIRLEEKDERNQLQKFEFFAANQAAVSVSNATKRQRISWGATKQKDRKLNVLKTKRKARAYTRYSSPKRNMEPDDEEEEDQISNSDQDDNPSVDITFEQLAECWLPRTTLVRQSEKPWFEELVKGAWVRYLIGTEDNTPVYRLCEVVGIGSELVKPYKIGNNIVRQSLELKHGHTSKTFLMDKVSDSLFDQKEFDIFIRIHSLRSIRLPSSKDLERKRLQIHSLLAQTMTESDVAAILAQKNQLTAQQATRLCILEKAKLNQARALAECCQHHSEVAQIDVKLAKFEVDGELDNRNKDGDVLAILSERNRQFNSETARRAELEAERRRRWRSTMLNPGSKPVLLDTQEQEKELPLVNGSNFFESISCSVEVDLGDF